MHWLRTSEKITNFTTTTRHFNLDGSIQSSNHPLNSRGATCPPPHHQRTAHPSWDTCPRAEQFLPILPSTTPRLLHSDFPKCALRFCRNETVSKRSRKGRKHGEGRILTKIQEAG